MNRTLRRPMFRMGGAAEGITSGLDRKPLANGTDPYDRAMKTTERFRSDMDKFRGEQSPFAPSALPGFLTSFGLNLLSETPRGNIFQTAATAAKEPFKTFQAATLANQQDERDRTEDMFGTALASEYDLEAQRIKSSAKDEKTFAKEQAAGAVEGLYNTQIGAIKSKIETLDKDDPNYLDKVDDFNKTIADIEKRKRNDIKSIYLSQKTIEEFQREVILKLLQNNDIEDILPFFPNLEQIMGPGFKLPQPAKDGGRMGYKFGTKPEPMMAPVVEEKKQTGEVQDLSYTELRARLPQEISNEIVMLLANSKQALLDFANIQTGEDIASFNQQYDVNLTLPQGA
jgi:hypothetical protein